MSAELELSVVTPTYNRRARLLRVLAALARQTTPASRFEVVVVDDGSTDGTSDALRPSDYPFALRVIRQKNGGPARARNAGVNAAEGNLVLFLDDDVEPSATLIEEHLRSHAAERGPVVVIGPLASLPHYPQPWVAWEQEKVEEQYLAMKRGDWAPSFRQFWTGNASVGRRYVLDAGGFNPEFLRGEDVELGQRLAARGMQFRFNPKAIGLHHAERSLDSWSMAHTSYGRVEVQIFGNIGDDHLITMLSENYARVHAGTRLVMRHCRSRPLTREAVVWLMRGFLRSPVAPRVQGISNKVCGALANLLYWHASEEALGHARFESVLSRSAAG
jgi:glycosyltransferase involved in cell wall biosynthesis